jgi:hypothetical protein
MTLGIWVAVDIPLSVIQEKKILFSQWGVQLLAPLMLRRSSHLVAQVLIRGT